MKPVLFMYPILDIYEPKLNRRKCLRLFALKVGSLGSIGSINKTNQLCLDLL